MRKLIALAVLPLGLAVGLPAQAHGLHFHHQQCGYATDYDVHVAADGIAFTREQGAPERVFMHDGMLRVDGRDVAVSAADATRLRAYEGQVRALLPEVAGIARAGVDIGFDAITTVAAAFTDGKDERRRVLAQLGQEHRQALAQIDQGLGRGEWNRHAMDELIGHDMGDTVATLVGGITTQAVEAALSGDQAKVAALTARADALDRSIDQAVDARADALGRRADALCPRLDQLATLQQQFQFRLRDGAPLQLLRRDANDTTQASATKPVVRR